MGNICTAFFASQAVARLDGTTVIAGGWLDHHWVQLGYQLADSVAGGLYSFTLTTLILFIINMVPGLRLRAHEESEILGIDDAEIGEFAYDYVELTREVLNDDVVVGAGHDVPGTSLYSRDQAASPFDPREKNSIPLMDARAYAGNRDRSAIVR